MSGIKSFKKIIICIALLLVVVAMCCFGVVRAYSKYQKELDLQIEDQNGDSKALYIITDEIIEGTTENYRSIKRRVISKGNNQSGVTGKYEDCDSAYVENRFGMLSGLYISNAYLGQGEDVTYTIDSKVELGNLRIVITDETNAILYEVPIDSKEDISFFAEDGKVYYVKLAGESAKVDITISRNNE